MNKKPILIDGFAHYSDSGLQTKTDFIIANMTGNSLYTDAGTKLTNTSTALTAFNVARANRGRALNYKAVKTAARNSLITALEILGRYVSDKYPLNVANWQTSGFDVQTFDGTTQIPAVPVNVRAKDGESSGMTAVRCSPSVFAIIYEGRHWKQGQAVPASNTVTGSSRLMLFTNLEVGSTYSFEVRARGTKGVSDWSNPITWVVR